MISYAVILVAALALNAGNLRMLALCLVAAAGIFCPIPDASFYLVCMLVEFAVAGAAFWLAAPGSMMIVRISALLAILHALGWALDGYPPASPYHASVKALEHAELIMCCLFSRPIFTRCFHA